MSEPNKIGERIRQRRIELGMSQSKLARILGVSIQSISLWENAKTSFSSSYLPPLASALNCDVMWILSGDGEHAKNQEKQQKDIRLANSQHPKDPVSVQNLTIDSFIADRQKNDTNLTDELYLLISIFSGLSESRRSLALSKLVELSKEDAMEQIRIYEDTYKKLSKNRDEEKN